MLLGVVSGQMTVKSRKARLTKTYELSLCPGDLVQIRDIYLEDGRPPHGLVLRKIDPGTDLRYSYCDWWLLYDGGEEAFSEGELELVARSQEPPAAL